MITDYASLQSEIIDWSYRTDIAARVPTFIQLCETDIQIRCKLLDFEGYGTVAITGGAGTLPTGFTAMRSAYWNGNLATPLQFITPDRFDSILQTSGTGYWYTIIGDQIRVKPGGDGDVVMTYSARLVPLSTSGGSNVILDRYPDAYLRGSLMQFASWAQDDARLQKEALLYEPAIERILSDNAQRKYAGPLTIKPR